MINQVLWTLALLACLVFSAATRAETGEGATVETTIQWLTES